MNSDEYRQLELERMQRLDEALERAEAGRANEDDWNIIRYECGAPKRPVVILKTVSIGARNESHSG
jgi:hypothetical protein